MQRIPLLLATLSLLPSCATEVVTTHTQAATAYAVEGRRCDPSFCILFEASDSDRDGVADDDEIAAGTDPNDPSKYPTMIDLARLMAKHELPTWELGNSLMVLVPTRDANGLPIFGGEAALPGRKSGLETAGIKTPDGLDLSRGFTMARTAENNELSFGQLFTAFGREDKGTMPVRLLADAIGWDPSADWTITNKELGDVDGPSSAGGSLEARRAGTGEELGGRWSIDGNKSSFSVWNEDGSFQQTVDIVRNPDGSTTAKTTTKVHPENSEPGTWDVDTTETTTSKDGNLSVSHSSSERVKCEEGGSCVPDPAPHSDADDYGTDNDHGGYMDPEAAEHSGVITATPGGMASAISKLQTTVRVMPNDNDPTATYEVPPTGIHDHYGPIALYGGDPESTYVTGGFGLTPAFVRVPQPEYDPNLQEQKPPMTAPPDGTCLYCFQPPAKP